MTRPIFKGSWRLQAGFEDVRCVSLGYVKVFFSPDRASGRHGQGWQGLGQVAETPPKTRRFVFEIPGVFMTMKNGPGHSPKSWLVIDPFFEGPKTWPDSFCPPVQQRTRQRVPFSRSLPGPLMLDKRVYMFNLLPLCGCLSVSIP